MRHYSPYSDEQAIEYLNALADHGNPPACYQDVMYKIGRKLGKTIRLQLDNSSKKVCLACTSEDADYLAKGILDDLEESGIEVNFVCFWNKRFTPFEEKSLNVAPILRIYQEPSSIKIKTLIIVKSIISSACVVKTNLMNLIEKENPEEILIVSPVMYETAEEGLKNEFNEEVYKKFLFLFFAQDNVRDENGIVDPGIGGDVYERLGFKNQDDKNTYIPNVVKTRRVNYA
jgi:hypothetical protein